MGRMTGLGIGELARDYLLATRHGGSDAIELERRLAALEEPTLAAALNEDRARIAFWLDVYNAAVIRAGSVDLTSPVTRWRHFGRRSVVVAGRHLSLDDIEHGLLRRSRWKLGLGYLGNPAPSPFERRHRVAHVDARIHFALNCGAASCPPLAAYDRTHLEEQLALASSSFLASEVVASGSVLRVPGLLLWYIGDFGGPPGLRRMLREAGVGGWGGPIRFSTYDWTPTAGRWLDTSDRSGGRS
jgi:hypothetical protein